MIIVIWVRVKLQFPLISPFYFFKSLLRAVLEASLSWTIEGSDVSSEKSVTYDTKLSDISLM